MPQAASGQAGGKIGFLPAEFLILYQKCTGGRRGKSTDAWLWKGGSMHMKCSLQSERAMPTGLTLTHTGPDSVPVQTDHCHLSCLIR